MLKRYQVLLNGWMADFIKEMSSAHDISFSEAVRLGLCVYYGSMISELYPEHKFEYSPKKIVGMIKKNMGTPRNEEEMHKTISNIYFETRKAMEYFHKQGHGQKKPAE